MPCRKFIWRVKLQLHSRVLQTIHAHYFHVFIKIVIPRRSRWNIYFHNIFGSNVFQIHFQGSQTISMSHN